MRRRRVRPAVGLMSPVFHAALRFRQPGATAGPPRPWAAASWTGTPFPVRRRCAMLDHRISRPCAVRPGSSGRLAQLVRAPPLQGGGRGFESLAPTVELVLAPRREIGDRLSMVCHGALTTSPGTLGDLRDRGCGSSAGTSWEIRALERVPVAAGVEGRAREEFVWELGRIVVITRSYGEVVWSGECSSACMVGNRPCSRTRL